MTYLEALRQTYKVDADQLFIHITQWDPQLNLAQFGSEASSQAHKWINL